MYRIYAVLLAVLALTAGRSLAAPPDPSITDEAVNMVLRVDNNGTRFTWELEYGLARQKALEYLKAGKDGKMGTPDDLKPPL